MKQKWIITLGLVAALILVVVMVKRSSGTVSENIQQNSQEFTSEKEISERTEKENSEEVVYQPCEHNMAIYLCDECRYEAGVVKISNSMIVAGKKSGLIQLKKVSIGNVDDILEATGEIQLNQNLTARLSPAISGVLYSSGADIGQKVSKDQTLFTIHSAELGKAVSEYRKSVSLTGLSEKNYEREKSLYERNISSELDVSEKQMEYARNRAEMEAAEQSLYALGLEKDYMEKLQKNNTSSQNIGLLPVKAPFGGTVIEKNASIGELIGPDKDVFIIADLSTMWVWADVYEKDLQRLLSTRKNGVIKAVVQTSSFPERSFSGVVDYIGSTVDKETRTVKVRASVRNDEMLLRAGMFCKIMMNMGTSGEKALIIPRKALLSDEGKDFVFAKWKDEYYIRKPVKKGREMIDSFEIVEGLNTGDDIIVDGAFLLKSDILREKMGAGCAD